MQDKTSKLAMAAHAMAESYVDMAFVIAAPTDAVDRFIAGAPDSPVQFPGILHVRRPLQAAELYEGCVIEQAIGLTLEHSARFQWLGKTVVPITEADRALVERNQREDLGAVNPPAATEPIGRAEIDGVAVDLVEGTLLLADIKRAPIPGERNGLRFAQACLAARRAASREGLRFARVRPLRIRWFSSGRRTQSDVANRATVDDALGIPIREVVDYAITSYRAAFALRFRALLEGVGPRADPPFDAVAEQAAAPILANSSVHAFDPAALHRAFGRNTRHGRAACCTPSRGPSTPLRRTSPCTRSGGPKTRRS